MRFHSARIVLSSTLFIMLQQGAVSVIMCDIDFFKRVNDTYGHNAGDAVLVHISQLLSQAVKDCGEVVRWGGEEFVMILTGCTEQQAADVAENIRKQVAESVCMFEGQELQVTMSFGVKQMEQNATPDENIENADGRLYNAKTSGRNRVVTESV